MLRPHKNGKNCVASRACSCCSGRKMAPNEPHHPWNRRKRQSCPNVRHEERSRIHIVQGPYSTSLVRTIQPRRALDRFRVARWRASGVGFDCGPMYCVFEGAHRSDCFSRLPPEGTGSPERIVGQDSLPLEHGTICAEVAFGSSRSATMQCTVCGRRGSRDCGGQAIRASAWDARRGRGLFHWPGSLGPRFDRDRLTTPGVPRHLQLYLLVPTPTLVLVLGYFVY